MDFNSIFHQVWLYLQEWYWVPLLFIYLGVIFTILIENGNPTKTIAWILVILFLPIIGIIIYYFFGQAFKKELYFKHLDTRSSQDFLKMWDQLEDEISKDLTSIENEIGDQVKVFKHLNHTYSSAPFLNNKVQLLTNGEEKFPAFLEAIKHAEHHIHLEYYIFELDNIGTQIIDLLKQKASEGIEVRITTDDFGSPELNKKAHKIFENTGIDYQTFLPVRFNSLANSNFRNHRKILIVDGKIAFVGGINISDKYINSSENKLFWRDTSVRIEGNAVSLLQIRFWLDWKMTEGKNFIIQSYHYIPIYDDNIGNSMVSFGFSSPGSNVQSALESMILALALAKKKIRLTTPYFVPSDEFKSALLIAANSGVEVELLIPSQGDSLIVQEASLSFTKRLMEQGVKVYRYKKGFVHAKTITIDDDLAFIGTVNLDNRSFYINFELTAVIHDKELITQLNTNFEQDKLDAELMTFEMWKNVPVYRRAFASICRLLAPIL